MKSEDPGLAVGDFLRVSGKLKVDFYLSRAGAPTGTLLIIAFEATKIAKPSAATAEVAGKANESANAGVVVVAAAVSTAVSLPLRETATPSLVSPSANAIPPSREVQPAQAKPLMAAMQSMPSFALPSPVASPWAMSFGAPVQAK